VSRNTLREQPRTRLNSDRRRPSYLWVATKVNLPKALTRCQYDNAFREVLDGAAIGGPILSPESNRR
jgi:hypothetical protein